MTPSIQKLLPEISALSHTDKFQLAHILLIQLAEEDGIELFPSKPTPKVIVNEI